MPTTQTSLHQQTTKHNITHTHATTRHKACKPHHHHNSETLSHLRPARHDPPSHIIVKTHKPTHTINHQHRCTPRHACVQATAKSVERKKKKKKKKKTTTHKHRHIRHQHIPPSITHTREWQPHERHSTNKQSNTKSHTHRNKAPSMQAPSPPQL